MQITEYDKARFWSRVDVKTQQMDFDGGGSCWEWKGSKHLRDARGQFIINGRREYAPRIAYEIIKGPLPDGMYVCHTCDNPNCVNPRHLFAGTNQENQEDCTVKGRKKAKMTPEIVRAIRKECIPESREFGYSALARKYGVNPGAIWNAHNRTRWAWVEDEAH